MGTFNVTFRLANLQGGEQREVESLVDTGSMYSILPAPLLHALDVQPVDSDLFELADGRVMRHEIGDVIIRVNGRSSPSRVIFGPEDAEPVLGAHALEGLRLVVDPYNERLLPASRLRM